MKSKICNILFCLLVATGLEAQNSFSPFNFLNSFLSQVPGWPLNIHQSGASGVTGGKHHHRSAVQTKQQKQNFFRPHLQLGPSISPSQNAPNSVQLSPSPSPVFKNPEKNPTISVPKVSHAQNVIPQQAVQQAQAAQTAQTPISINGVGAGVGTGSSVFIGSPQVVSVTESRNNNKVDIRAETSVTPIVPSFKKTDTSSGPNPGDEFPIISLIDEPIVNYYDTVLQNIGPISNQPNAGTLLSSQPSSISSSSTNSFQSSQNLNSFQTDLSSDNLQPTFSNTFKKTFSIQPLDTFSSNQNTLNANPYYAPEEFTYNQDPILIEHDDNENEEDAGGEIVQDLNDDLSEVTQVKLAKKKNSETEANYNEINDVTQKIPVRPTLLPTFFEELEQISKKTEKSSRSLFPQDLFRKRVKAKEQLQLTNLVKTVEYKPSDVKTSQRIDNKSSALNYVSSVTKCADLQETGYCSQSISSDYYQQMLDSLLENCADVMSAFKAFVPEDIDSLGDNSDSVISSEKDQDRPWSWTVSAYKKKPVCQSDLSFIRPSYVLNTKGEAHVVIQTKDIQQSVSLDRCSRPGSPCPGLGQCDTRSLCVQRYQHQYLLSIPDAGHYNNSINKCQAVITAVKFPSGCVCHAQTSEVDNDFGFGDKLV